jgi:hypothetical protein
MFSYHLNIAATGTSAQDSDYMVSFFDAEKITIEPFENFETESLAKKGTAGILVTSSVPPATVLKVQFPHGDFNAFFFTDADLADRVAKAMTHAIELCGGGNKEPF